MASSVEIRSERYEGVMDAKVIFRSSDGVEYQLATAVAMAVAPGSQMIPRMIKDNSTGSIPVLNFQHEVLDKVVDYFYKHAYLTNSERLVNWEASFVKVGQAMLYDLMQAAYYLNIEGLLFITCKAVANLIKDKTPEEIRKTLNIPEEEEVILPKMRTETFHWTRKVTRISAGGKIIKEEIHREEYQM